MNEKRKVGRPRKAAQSVDEAVHLVVTGTAPKRGRNAIERAVMSKGRDGKRGGGRPTNPQSRTQQAAQLAMYLIQNEGETFANAVKLAAVQLGVNQDNVRKYARKIAIGPTATVKAKVTGWAGQLVPGGVAAEKRPLLVAIRDARQQPAQLELVEVISDTKVETNFLTSSYPD